MLHVCVTGLAPNNWSSRLAVALQMRKFARAARRSPDCLAAKTFRKNGRVFLYTVWEDKFRASLFQSSQLYNAKMKRLTAQSSLIDTHAFVCRRLPGQRQLIEMWNSARYVMAA